MASTGLIQNEGMKVVWGLEGEIKNENNPTAILLSNEWNHHGIEYCAITNNIILKWKWSI